MIRIKPDPEIQIFCPKCSRKTRMEKIVMQTAFALADCTCKNCGFEFYQTLPVGHTIINTLTITKTDGVIFPCNTPKTWLTKALFKAHHNPKQESVQIKKSIYKKCDRVIILNALDYLYGHVLLKLYNSAFHLDNQKDLGLIVIVPKSFEWLIPQGVAESWVVDLKLNEFAYNHLAIQEFISKEIERFDTIYLSKAYSHPDFKSIDISRFTRIKPFNLTNFTRLQPTFTFVLREDRWWWKNKFDYWFYRLCRKLKVLKTGRVVLSMRQDRLVRKTITQILKKIPDAKFYIIGLGSTGNFEGYARDERRKNIDDTVEKEWCKIYAQTHVVIGIHGSNLLLPTAHAAGCLEILPEDRYGNIVQDISVRYADRKQLYLYRFADQYSHPKNIAKKAISMIENFEVFENNMCQNIYLSDREPISSVGTMRDDIYAIH